MLKSVCRVEEPVMRDKLFKAGEYVSKFNTLTGQTLPCGPIYQSAGLEKHVKKHQTEKADILSDIPAVIRQPDYIGRNPKEPDSIELVKKSSENVMVCVKLDSKNEYLYVASVYTVSKAKLNHRLNSGRLKSFDNCK